MVLIIAFIYAHIWEVNLGVDSVVGSLFFSRCLYIGGGVELMRSCFSFWSRVS
jgi:hypothetical protein